MQEHLINHRLPVPLPSKVKNLDQPVQKAKISWDETRKTEGEINYQGILSIPKEFDGYRILLRMDSVGCEAHLSINGMNLGQHYGSYTEWDCDITDALVDHRGTAAITLRLLDRAGELSPYQYAGIFRGISILALPLTFVGDLSVQTKENEQQEMELLLAYTLLGTGEEVEEIELLLEDEKDVILNKSYYKKDLALDQPNQDRFQCPQVKRWDSEHPYLYQLRMRLKNQEQVIEEVMYRIGFRHLETKEGKVLWNHKPLKLRGICYREPLETEEGRDIHRELTYLQEANINYIRGLYYPFSKRFLELCDTMGFYVEEATAVNEVGQTIAYTQNSPEYLGSYLNQLEEMLHRDRSHVSILLWSLGSDSTWGANFRACYQLAKNMDASRLINFHFPMTIPEEEAMMDVWSNAYVSYKLDLDQCYDHMAIEHTQGSDNAIGYAVAVAPYDIPVLHDAFAHLPCYNRDQIERDPGIHEFWGESIKRYWDKMWKTTRCLGGAIMAGVDEDGSFSKNLQDFNWGILDRNGNPKPEYHHVRMSYSPIVVKQITVTEEELSFELENRFNHTTLSEIRLRYSYRDKVYERMLDELPWEHQRVRIPIFDARSYPIWLTFIHGDRVIYETGIEPSVTEYTATATNYPPYTLTENEKEYILDNSIFTYHFSKERMSITSALVKGKPVITGGPHLQTTRLTLEEWKGLNLQVSLTEEGARVIILGEYGNIVTVSYVLQLYKSGEIDTSYQIISLSKPMPHTVKAKIGLDPGGLDELGVYYDLSPGYEDLSWKREGIYFHYPKDHLGRREGVTSSRQEDDYRSMKHQIKQVILSNQSAGTAVEVTSDGSHSVRVMKLPHPLAVLDDRDERIRYRGDWYEMDDYCGNHGGTETLSNTEGDTLEIDFVGSGITIYGPRDLLYGKCDIYLDHELVAKDLSQYLAAVDFPAMSRGYEKRYQVPLYQIHGLDEKQHTLQVKVQGAKEKGSQNTYVSLDYAVIEGNSYPRGTRLIINNDYNYTRLVRGNYMREKVSMYPGYYNSHKIRIIGQEVGEAI